MTSRQLRFLRAAAVSAIATLLAAVSHTLAGGAAPHPLLIAAVAVLFVPLSAAVAGGRPSRARVAVAVLLAQAAFHLLFQLLGAPTAGGASVIGTHAHHLDLGALAPLSPAPGPDTLMLSAHLACAVLTTLLLWHGESVLRAIARWFQAALRRAATPTSAPPAPPRPLRSALRSPLDAAMTVVVSRRGPPVPVGG
ncbi:MULTISPECIES: hypothetical protein [unclassified Microbacterium]|jgi:hypothetical protein|uniref:hypothetical protein n=2 Tax=Microbacterium TaxID=33882 RepID=UPI001656E1E5|nr:MULTISPECIES: hypothetical protein [unclassified Microbacterium]MCT1364848.1 hypothetical protein [Microbacterium sp. p3-SID131]MCT1377543.1 hypothetical protein [Microbacterium sp. p3-SID337]MDH5134224.1 hypothetical protein [Microbacterium sp. RD10]MDH5138503.1 hypothetical protein [Microbacterium sp. RD11]MDH5146804.1 hypothetical protein [Microbacterium sp. RD12]